ncbi:tyrosine-type recombinase/integrase [Dyadobacter sp. CY261]|uniref:tyrosine-type recombinase/integrase n=1 Tax=Dyadobacter sp. CY261 TaxID=2907203 RepID=UPI001F2EC1BE|nr:integrase arm-type DNA-binding domain-containing protein [Dyadobacter sp. CY261]MCF0075205.1 tyrosine-type recombinase/integrase [Dyadobacter sp. CY261]
MSLTDLKCRTAKPKDKAYRLVDSGGLFLDMSPTGRRTWRLKYRFQGKEKLLTIGPYPAISILDARIKSEAAKERLLSGLDPCQLKQDEKKLAEFKNAQTVELIAMEWYRKNLSTWAPSYGKNVLSRLKLNVFPFIGQHPISKITVQHILVCAQKVENRGKSDLAHRVLQMIGQIMRYAVVTGRAERDLTVDLRGALKKYRKGHFASIDIDELPKLLKALERNDVRLFRQTVLAIRLILLTFVRTSELINATWGEFDLKKKLWHIPPERMKTRIAHTVPLSSQTIEILMELKKLYGEDGYILPSAFKRGKPMSNNAILTALGRLGYKKKMTGHGFRSLAMSAIKERLNYRHEVVDRQLAHQPKNKIDKAYDRAMFLPDRIKMMQQWADYIDRVSGKDKNLVKARVTPEKLRKSSGIRRCR